MILRSDKKVCMGYLLQSAFPCRPHSGIQNSSHFLITAAVINHGIGFFRAVVQSKTASAFLFIPFVLHTSVEPVHRAVKAFQDVLFHANIDNTAAALGIVFSRWMRHQLNLVYGGSVGRA